jgi:hypothetical protein
MGTIIRKINLRNSTLIILTLIIAFCRLIPVMPNFSPLGAVALFGAAQFRNKYQAFLLPLFAVWLSDLFVNNLIYSHIFPEFTFFYDGFYWQYAGYILITLGGIFIFRKINTIRILSGSLFASFLFFTISNFGCWIGNPFYPQNINGLLTCYAAGIPFIKGTLLGNLFYSVMIFSTFYALEILYPKLKLTTQGN